ncbi:Copper chaperone domain-containing protein [Dioscorea alata]|uniref:Copper chaperone domain-containing protein n=1 Tax=Dioscorea alata TaxID=55571 RepID=A0ACB7WHR6_DIOAL|nr:Copper chaperone domain-containing protein [Dioscorea alata]
MVALEKKEVIVAEKEKQEEVITAIYKLNLHCQECARSIEKHVTRISGVQKVDTDVESGKVTVKGIIDVKKIHELIEKKSKRKVEIISPKPKEKDDKVSAEKVVEKKEDVVRTIVMKVQMHCENCEHDLKWRLLKLKGVHSVKMNREAGTCTVTGTVEEKKLIEYIRRKTKKHVEVVPQKQKEEEKKKTEEKVIKEKETEAKGGAKEEVKKVEIVEKKEEVKITEIVVPYFIHCTHAPQWFSDEDPNSCSVM